MSKHTDGPWKVGDFDESGGYDCMTAGISAGPAVLDGEEYGQDHCVDIAPEAKERMIADASLIAAAPTLLSSAEWALRWAETLEPTVDREMVLATLRSAIAKAKGEA